MPETPEPMAATKNAKAKRLGKRHRQYAALPVRLSPLEGDEQVLLLTSRGTGRWVIPKGWPMRKLAPAAVAAREAYEEAGLEGTIDGESPIGHYHYHKHLDGGGEAKVEVDVFLLRVERQLVAWPEKAERETRWFGLNEAAEMAAEPELAAILRDVRERGNRPV